MIEMRGLLAMREINSVVFQRPRPAYLEQADPWKAGGLPLMNWLMLQPFVVGLYCGKCCVTMVGG